MINAQHKDKADMEFSPPNRRNDRKVLFVDNVLDQRDSLLVKIARPEELRPNSRSCSTAGAAPFPAKSTASQCSLFYLLLAIRVSSTGLHVPRALPNSATIIR